MESLILNAHVVHPRSITLRFRESRSHHLQVRISHATHTIRIRSHVFTPPHHLLVGSFDRTIKVLNMRTKRVVATLTGHSDAITCLLNNDNGTL